MDVRLELPRLKCTGCGVCASVCPKDAISMDINESGFGSGFRYPHVDTEACIECGKCVRTCPVLGPDYSALKKPQAFSVKCPSYQMQCASGGVFGFLAEHFISEGGGVVGAAFDENFNLKERYVETLEELPPLLMSKYLQSDPGNIYEEVKKALNTGKKVLFCSTPCQVAALKAYLKKIPSNLYCIDLLCHGVPSNRIFKRYIEEEVNGKVTEVEFRSKEVGWIISMTLVRPSGRKDHIGRKADPYIRLFESWAALRQSCYVCPFNRIPRQGDLTIGDHWGVGAARDRKGVSIVLANNKKGKVLMEILRNGGNMITEVDVPSASTRNRAMTKPTAKPAFYPKINYALDRMSIVDSLWYAGLVQKDVCMVIMSNSNFGNNLTNWSLYRAIKELGYSVVITSKIKTHNKSPLFQKNPYLPDETYTLEQYDLNKYCKIFVVGCDQTFAPLGIKKERLTLLPWVRGDRYKMSYSASLGKSEYTDATKDQIREFAFLLKRFDAISVRESSGPEVMRRTFGVEAEYVLDPVFLTPPSEYRRLARRSTVKIPEEKYVHCYLLDPTPEKIADVKAYAKKAGIGRITCIVNKGKKESIDGFEVIPAKIESFIKLIDNCDLFLTDSFHGMCTAIILNKNFYALSVREFRGQERFRSILDALDLQDRWGTLEDARFDDIDYDAVNEKLKVEVDRSRDWLAKHLEEGMNFDKPLDAYDMQLINADRIQNYETNAFKSLSLAMNSDCRQSDIFEPTVCTNMGRFNLDGSYLPQDTAKAIGWLRRACDCGDATGMELLFKALAEMDDEDSERDRISIAR